MFRVIDRTFRIFCVVGLIAWIAWMVTVQTDYEYMRAEEDAARADVAPSPTAEPATNPWALNSASNSN